MTTARGKLLDWLRDAQATEEEAHSLLKQVGGDISGNMAFSTGLEREGERAGRRAKTLSTLLEQLGGERSLLKTVTGLLHAQAQSIRAQLTRDEPAKALIAATSLASALVASYRLLLVAAKTAGEEEVGRTCQQLLAELHEFSNWLDEQAAKVAERYLSIKTVPPTGAAALPSG